MERRKSTGRIVGILIKQRISLKKKDELDIFDRNIIRLTMEDFAYGFTFSPK
jgi:hypothetical protein